MAGTFEIKPLTDDQHARWDAFVDRCSSATFFHRAGWRTVVARSFNNPTHFIYAERAGEIVGVMPIVETKSLMFGHALVSNGYSVCGGPATDDPEAYAALIAAAEGILAKTGAKYLEVRCPSRPREDWKTRSDLYAGFSGPLPADEDANLKQIPRKQRAVVRKAIESTLTWEVTRSVDELYDLYALSVRNLGTPVFGKIYFQSLLDVFGKDADVLTVRHEGKATASVLNFYFKDRVLPFYTGSVPTARRLGANDFMYWRLMRHAAGRGCTVYDFGRSKVGTGPYDFKKNWGFSPVPLTHQFLTQPGVPLPDVNPMNPKYRLFIAMWKKLPLPVANLLGPIIVRNIA